MRVGIKTPRGLDYTVPLDMTALPADPAVARLTPDSNSLVVGQAFTISASTSQASSGATIVSYTFTLTSKPVGSSATLVTASTSTRTLTPDVAGAYVVTLTILDSAGQTDTHSGRTYSANAVPNYVPAGDWNTADVNPAGLNGNTSTLWTHNYGNVAEPFAALDQLVTIGYLPRIHTVSGKSWTKEAWTYKPAVKQHYGYELKADATRMGFAANLVDLWLSTVVLWPTGFEPLGGMKMPNLLALDATGGLQTAYNNLHSTGWEIVDGSTAGYMSHLRSSDPNRVGLHVYLTAFEVGGVGRRGPDEDHLSVPVNLSPTSSTRYLADKNTPIEIVTRMRLNDVGVANGIFSLYAQNAGSARVLRYTRSDIEYRLRTTTFVRGINSRNFWGGSVSTESPAYETTANNAPRFIEHWIATTLAGLPIPRAS